MERGDSRARKVLPAGPPYLRLASGPPLDALSHPSQPGSKTWDTAIRPASLSLHPSPSFWRPSPPQHHLCCCLWLWTCTSSPSSPGRESGVSLDESVPLTWGPPGPWLVCSQGGVQDPEPLLEAWQRPRWDRVF